MRLVKQERRVRTTPKSLNEHPGVRMVLKPVQIKMEYEGPSKAGAVKPIAINKTACIGRCALLPNPPPTPYVPSRRGCPEPPARRGGGGSESR